MNFCRILCLTNNFIFFRIINFFVKYVVLQRRNDSARKFVQTSLSSLAMWYCYRRQPEVFQARISTLVTITEQTATVVRAGVTKALAASTGLLAVAESALAEVKLWLLS